MPKLSDTMTEGTVASWNKKVGDKVKSGEVLAEIETDKATMEFESFQDGVLLYIGVEKGKTAKVDSILAILGKEGEDVSALIASDAVAAPVAASAPTPAPAPAGGDPGAAPGGSANSRAADGAPPADAGARAAQLVDTAGEAMGPDRGRAD